MNDESGRRVEERRKVDRRSGKDRRVIETSPPGGTEHRRNVEPRMIEVSEVELDEKEWEANFGEHPVQKK